MERWNGKEEDYLPEVLQFLPSSGNVPDARGRKDRWKGGGSYNIDYLQAVLQFLRSSGTVPDAG